MRKKMLSVLLSTAMVGGLFAGMGTVASADDEVVTLQMLSLTSNTSGLQENTWWADLIKEKTGVQIELLPAGDQGEQKLQALMASGSLPDLVIFKDPKQVSNAVAGDMLLSLEDYKDLLPDVYENASAALKYCANELSEGQGKPYSVGLSISKNEPTVGTTNYGPRLRYDYYKEIGSPAIEKISDYLDVLKQMQDAHPTNDEGKPVYGFSYWSDWDQSYSSPVSWFMTLEGCYIEKEASLAYIDVPNDSTIHALTDPDGAYLKYVKMMYDANQMGLVDPDFLTQRFDDAQQKFTEGRVLYTPWSWGTGSFDSKENHDNLKGFEFVSAKEAQTLVQPLSPVGSRNSIAVSSSTKYPEECMKFIDYIFSDEGVMDLMNGPQGVTWDVNEDGKPYLTEEGYAIAQDPTKEIEPGDGVSAGFGTINMATFSGDVISKTYGEPFASSLWSTYEQPEDKLFAEWSEDMGGVRDQIDYLKKNTDGGLVIAKFAPMPATPDDMKQIEANAGSVIQQYTYKMIFAADEEEYNALQEEMISQAEAAGIDEYVSWYTEAYEKAVEDGAQYTEE